MTTWAPVPALMLVIPNSYASSRDRAPFKTDYCEYCDEKCTDCMEHDGKNMCMTCSDGEKAYKSECLDDCPLYYFDDSGLCRACVEGCEHCSDDSTCDVCGHGYTADGAICNRICEAGQFWSPITEGCELCPTDCLTCHWDFLASNVACDTCKGDYKITPAHTCVEKCIDEGYVDQSGMCQVHCNEGWGPNHSNDDICMACEQDHCNTCFFDTRQGFFDEHCTSCQDQFYLKQDSLSQTQTECVEYLECKGPLSPIRRTQGEHELWLCLECDGYFDHSRNYEEPVCKPCSDQYCGWCAWDFEMEAPQCVECRDGAIYDPASRDCRGECGQIIPFFVKQESGPLRTNQKTCIEDCDVYVNPADTSLKYVSDDRYECRICD